MEMYSLAENHGEMPMTDRQPYYPSVRLMSDNCPKALATKEVGHVCNLHIVAKKMSERAMPNGKKEITIELMQVGYAEESDYEDEKEEA